MPQHFSAVEMEIYGWMAYLWVTPIEKDVSTMSNEMDLHTSADTPASGVDRILVYYYAVLVFFTGLFVLRVQSGTLMVILLGVVVILAALPVLKRRADRRNLQSVRDAQLAEFREAQKAEADKKAR